MTYAFLDEINTHKQMASELGWCRYVDMAGIDLVDDIHPSADDDYDFAADNTSAQWLGQRAKGRLKNGRLFQW